MGRYGIDRYGIEEYGSSSSFSDVLGPLLIPVDPVDSEVGVPIGTNIQIRITDVTSINLATLEIDVDKGAGYSPAFVYGDATKFKSGWDGPGSAYSGTVNDFLVTIDPTMDFAAYQNITVRVLVYDTLGNPVRLS